MKWTKQLFPTVFKDITSKATKVDQSHFLPFGQYAIVDQGQEFIAGYTDDKSKVWDDNLPVVIFGDHTRTLKYVDFPFVLGADGTKVLKPSSDLHPLFAYYALVNLNIPSAGYNRHFKYLKEMSVFYPVDKDEQKRIATILEEADRARRTRRFTDGVSDNFLQEVFVEMFGDPVTNPMGWDVVKLKELSNIQGGLQLSYTREKYDYKLPYLRVANVYDNYLDLSEIKYMGLTESEAKRTRLEKGDILVVEGHGNIEGIGRCAIWDGSIDNCIHQNHLIRVRPHHQQTNSQYISRFLNSRGGRFYLEMISNTTSGLNTISTGKLKECPILLPPVELQEQFKSVVQKHEKIQHQQKESARQANHLFQTLLHQAFRGEL